MRCKVILNRDTKITNFLRVNRLHFILILFFTPVLLLRAQPGTAFRYYTVDDGLAQNSIYDIIQDKQGFLWFATQDGLSRFDGHKFTNFQPVYNDTNSVSSNSTRCLLNDSRNKIWVGTRSGLNCYDPETEKFRRYNSKPGTANFISEDVVLALCEDRGHNIWVGTANEGINIIDPVSGTITALRHKEGDPGGLSGNDIRGLVCDASGHIWITTWMHGVNEYDPVKKTVTRYTFEKGQIPYPKTRGATCVTRTGKVWIGTWGKGACCIDLKTRAITFSDSIPGLRDEHIGMIWDITEDRDGEIWFATAEQGLFSYNPVTHATRHFQNNPNDIGSLSDNNTWCVMADRNGLIWAGTWQRGINVYNKRRETFGCVTQHSGDTLSLPNNTIWTFCEDQDKNIWIGTADGVFVQRPGQNQFIRPPVVAGSDIPGKGSNIQGMCCDRKGRIWMGTAGAGPLYYDPKQQRYTIFPGYKYSVFRTGSIGELICDNDGNIWFGGSDGLILYDEKTENFTAFNNLFAAEPGTGSITCMLQKDAQHFWLGTAAGGLYLVNTVSRTAKRIGKGPGGLRIQNISTLFMDSSNKLWVGTSGGGLHRYDESAGTFTVFAEKEGLPNNVINGISEGPKGVLWVSTNRGLCRIHPATGKTETFTADDGLQGNEFNQNAVLQSSDGRTWFGGSGGFNAFHPEKIKADTSRVKVIITAISVLNKPQLLEKTAGFTEAITLSYRDYFFSIDFSAMEFSNPHRNEYRYMLEGFDKDWVSSGTRRMATYTNIDHGEYVFRVKASNGDGVWSDEVTSLRIKITPPFWRTTWFYTLCIISLLLLIWGYIRWREKRLRTEKNMLETKVNERTHELKKEKEKVEAAHKDINDSINYARRIQDAILPHADEFSSLFPGAFVFYKPRNVVSGDFYWVAKTGDKKLIAIADCTGHGVPGALMSMIGNSLLNEIVKQEHISDPGKILTRLHEEVRSALKQNSGSETRDGMDIALLCFGAADEPVLFAGANRPLWCIRNGELQEIKPDKKAIGGIQDDGATTFTTHTVSREGLTELYLFSDGFADQFGGEKGKKFMLKRLHELLLENHKLDMRKQQEKLEQAHKNWMGTHEQVDDILVAGIRV